MWNLCHDGLNIVEICYASGKLLDDSKELGYILEKIPSPGFSIPLISDSYELPSINNIEDLRKMANSLEGNILLSK